MVLAAGGGDPIGKFAGDGQCVLGRVRSLSDMSLGFFGEELFDDALPPQTSMVEMGPSCSIRYEYDDGDEAEEGSHEGAAAEKKAFWETQHQLLQSALSLSSSLESRLRRALGQIRSDGACSCPGSADRECRKCKLRAIADRLRDAGYDCAICKSKWRSSPGIPSGEHIYLDVIHNSSTRKNKGPIRVVIEVSFRAEFEMARASEDYNSLVGTLPEIFVGRPERLRDIIKVVCAAAKRCMKDNGMHMAPWRKQKYMQAKWLTAPSERAAAEEKRAVAVDGGGNEEVAGRRSPKLRSMLSMDLLDKLPSLQHCTAVEVI